MISTNLTLFFQGFSYLPDVDLLLDPDPVDIVHLGQRYIQGDLGGMELGGTDGMG